MHVRPTTGLIVGITAGPTAGSAANTAEDNGNADESRDNCRESLGLPKCIGLGSGAGGFGIWNFKKNSVTGITEIAPGGRAHFVTTPMCSKNGRVQIDFYLKGFIAFPMGAPGTLTSGS